MSLKWSLWKCICLIQAVCLRSVPVSVFPFLYFCQAVVQPDFLSLIVKTPDYKALTIQLLASAGMRRKLGVIAIIKVDQWSTFIIAFIMCDWLLTLYILQPLEAAKSLPQRLMYPIMYPYYVLIVESPLSHNRSCFFTVVWNRCIWC